jgi:gluconate 2-dehydrogenase
MAVGYNNIDVPACTARGVLVTNAPDVLTETTADFGFALMMAAARRIAESEHFLRRGEWTKWSSTCSPAPTCTARRSASSAWAGSARRSRGAARRLRHAGDLSQPLAARRRGRGRARRALADKDELLRDADHLVIVVPYSAESHHSIGAAELQRMKPTATLTNIARGGIVDDAALAGRCATARSPRPGSTCSRASRGPSRPADVPNVVLTPHIASASLPTRRAMAGSRPTT